ncbi:unnamed protein product [Didymodactylos carnosus]|uniref:Periplasmic binding protein domain-containing protein n=1 Tax=Didymodactylos carnosus TaxID=1234261 RepID=A0A8S2HCD6_9BILA|nr:unnamed protein product [Didymodactylos carnosus]CAF3623208.1 unnamed protein product [Didymodactylos carnosus]
MLIAVGAVLAPNDGMADAAITALVDKGGMNNIRDNIFITGQDAIKLGTDHIIDGAQKMTVYKPDSVAGRIAVLMARTLIEQPDILPSDMEKAVAGIRDELIEASGILDLEFKMDTEQYRPFVNGKPVNTLLVTPVSITKQNVSLVPGAVSSKK